MALRLGDLFGSERAVLELPARGEPLEPAELDQLADPAAVGTLERKTLITSRMEGRTAPSLVKDEFVPNVMGASHGVRFSLRLWVLGAN